MRLVKSLINVLRGRDMTKEEIKYLLKRYKRLKTAIQEKRTSVFYTLSGKHERIAIDETVKAFVSIVDQALEMCAPFDRKLMQQLVLEERNDIYIFTHNSLAKSSYYQIKNRFLDNIYVLCVYSRLVSLDEIKGEQ